MLPDAPASGAGQPLPHDVRVRMERGLGADFTAVRVFEGAHVRALGARAYTRGTEVHFAPGEYDLQSERGLELLGHELAHVVQQASGQVTGDGAGPALRVDRALEAEADRMGARAARGEVGGGASWTAIAPTAGNVAQAKFGFEVELDLALGWSVSSDPNQADDQYTAPQPYLANHPIVGTADGVELHVDRSDRVMDIVPHSNAIVEIVTKPPIDEFTSSEQDVRTRMAQFTNLVAGFATATHNLTQRAALASVPGITATGQNAGHLFVGGSTTGAQQLANGYMQATFGVRLEDIPQLFTELAHPANTWDPMSSKAAGVAAANASNVFHVALALARKAWKAKEDGSFVSDWGETAKDQGECDEKNFFQLQQFQGLATLIINYLIIAKVVRPSATNVLLKNHVGTIFYKTALSTLRNAMDSAGRWVLDDRAALVEIIGSLATAGQRVPSEPLFPKVQPDWITVQTWLVAVLMGTSDPVWDQAKNPWSSEITGSVGEPGKERPAAALEQRRVGPPGGWKYTSPSELASPINRPIAEWAEVAVEWWNSLRAINGEPEKDSAPENDNGLKT